MVKFDPTKPVQTRSGLKARITDTELKGYAGRTIVAAYEDEEMEGYENISAYFPDGSYTGSYEHRLDLVNVREKQVKWMNIYPNGGGGILYESKKHADEARIGGRIACVRIEFEEGEGLD